MAEQGLFPGLRSFYATGIFSTKAVANFGYLMVNDTFSMLVALTILTLGFMLLCFLVWFAIVTQAGLVYNYSRIVANKKHDLHEGLNIGMKKFWPVFGFNAILKIVVYLIFFVLALPIVFWFAYPSIAQNLFFVVALS